MVVPAKKADIHFYASKPYLKWLPKTVEKQKLTGSGTDDQLFLPQITVI